MSFVKKIDYFCIKINGMNLDPKIKVCIGNDCDRINLYEQTGMYNPNNTSGWGNTNITTDDISIAEVKLYSHDSATIYETIILKNNVIDVYSPVVGSPTPGSFLAIKNKGTEIVDGVYRVEYSIEDINNVVYISNCYILNICGIEKCLQKLKDNIIGECSAQKKKELKEKIDVLEIIIYGIESSFSCKDFNIVDELIENAQIICDNICGCGC